MIPTRPDIDRSNDTRVRAALPAQAQKEPADPAMLAASPIGGGSGSGGSSLSAGQWEEEAAAAAAAAPQAPAPGSTPALPTSHPARAAGRSCRALSRDPPMPSTLRLRQL